MLPESRKRVSDMLRCVELIEQFVNGKSFAEFQADALLRAGVYYEFVIIGEALSSLRSAEESLVDRISEYKRIIGFRNQVIHGYQKIDDEITWRIIEQKIPVLRRELETLLLT
jgi:uncharacterized protein with HEPN domain